MFCHSWHVEAGPLHGRSTCGEEEGRGGGQVLKMRVSKMISGPWSLWAWLQCQERQGRMEEQGTSTQGNKEGTYFLELRHKLEQDQQSGQFAVGPVSCLAGSPILMKGTRPWAFDGVESVDELKAGQGWSDRQGVQLTKTLADKWPLLSFQPFWSQWLQETQTQTRCPELKANYALREIQLSFFIAVKA